MRCSPSWRVCPSTELDSALDRLLQSGLLSRQGAPPHATYLFKHALVQDAAYGTLLREPRRALHARIAEVLESQFPDIAETQPELLARHCTEAGLIEKAASSVGQGGTAIAGAFGARGGRGAADPRAGPDRRLARHAGPASRADQAPGRPRERPHAHQGLCGAPRPKRPSIRRALDRPRGGAGEPPEDPLTLFSVLYGFWARELCRVQWRKCCTSLRRSSWRSREGKLDRPAYDRASRHGVSCLLYEGDVAEGRGAF